MPKKLEDCVKQVSAQQIKKGKSEKAAKASAWAICQASQKESARWFKDGEMFLYVDPETFQVETVTEGEVPASATLYVLKEIERTDKVTPADKKRAEKEYGDVQYADEENKKYPLDAKHIHAAWSYINMPKNAAKYGAKAAGMKRKIAAAFKRITGHEPPSVAEKESENPPSEKELDDWFEQLSKVTPEEEPETLPEQLLKEPQDNPEKTGEAVHSHLHQHPGMKPHQHAHNHSGDTILNKEHLKEDHPMHDHMAGDEPEKIDNPEEEKAEEAVHSHEHQHPGMKAHSHPHNHSGEVVLNKQHLKEDHPMHDHAEGDEPEKLDNDAEENQEGVLSTSQMPMAMQAGQKKESTRTLVFGETVSLKEAAVDKAKKTVEVTLIKPGWSINGRYYSPEVLAKAVPVFEGTKSFLDHPSMDEEKNRPERSVADITGYYTGVKQADDGSLKAIRHFVGKGEREIWPLVLETVTNKPDLIGLSINALGHTEMGEAEGRKGVIVAELVKSFSVDDVTVASAGGKYERLMQSGDEMTQALLQHATYEEWRSANPEFEARMKKEMRTARKEELDQSALKEAAQWKERAGILETESKALTKQVESLQTKLADQERESALRVSEAVADYKLLASKLPTEWQKPLRESLKGKTGAEMDALIEAEKVKYFAVKEPVKVTGNPGTPTQEGLTVHPDVKVVLEALGSQSEIVPLDNESPEAYKARKQKLTRS